jgi:hypothetical protein
LAVEIERGGAVRRARVDASRARRELSVARVRAAADIAASDRPADPKSAKRSRLDAFSSDFARP